MKKRFLLSFFVLFSVIANAAPQKLPPQLLCQWLSPKTNVWFYGITDNYVFTEGVFWNYKVVGVINGQYQLALEQQGRSKKLYVKLVAEDKATIGFTAKSGITYNSKVNAAADYGTDQEGAFEKPLLKPGTVHLMGVLKGYNNKIDKYRYVEISFESLVASSKMQAIELDSLGRFAINFKLTNPHEVFIKFGEELQEFYAIPGHSLIIGFEIDRNNKLATKEDALAYITARPKTVFMGQDALLNTEFTDFSYRLRKMLLSSGSDEKQRVLDPQAYTVYRTGLMHQMQDTLSGYSQQHHTGKKFNQYFEQAIQYEAANELLRYRWLNQQKKLPIAYFDFFTTLHFNDEMGTLTKEYPATLHELSLVPYDDGTLPKTYPIEEILRYAKESNLKVTPDEENLIRWNVTFSGNGADSISYSYPLNVISDSLSKAISTPLVEGSRKAFGAQTDKKRVALLKRLGLDNGISADVLHARAAYKAITESKGADSAGMEKYRQTISNSVLFAELLAENQEFQERKELGLSPASHIIDHHLQAQDHLLETLAKQYKGKVVFVDFWAPWCGPCMGEMPESKTLKKELAGKDVVFLFLGVNCTEESWNTTIKQQIIEGEHYLLSKDEYALLSDQYNITGIPRYMLINKEGKLISDDAKRPRDRIGLINEITALLN